jgi:predicted ATP-grasp superfamily ATP-dependent carboligase
VVLTPRVDRPEFASAIRTEMSSRDYLGMMAASDAALVALSAPGADLTNKTHLALVAERVGLRTPLQLMFDDARSLVAAAPELSYPVVVKPSEKAGMMHRQARRFDSAAALAVYGDAAGAFVVQPYVDGEMHSVAGVMWNGRLVFALHQRHLRIWPAVCGDACAAVTTPLGNALFERVEQLLAGYSGVFQVEFVDDYLLDVNPRVYGSMEMASAVGTNLAGLYWGLVRGEMGEGAPRPTTARVGVSYCWWEGDARHLASAWREGAVSGRMAVAALIRGAAPAALAELAHDPRPFVSRLRYAASMLHRRRLAAPPSPVAASFDPHALHDGSSPPEHGRAA